MVSFRSLGNASNYEPVHRVEYDALPDMTFESSDKQHRLQRNMSTALLLSQHLRHSISPVGWIYQAPEQANLSTQCPLFRIFLKQCAEPHLQLPVQYLVNFQTVPQSTYHQSSQVAMS